MRTAVRRAGKWEGIDTVETDGLKNAYPRHRSVPEAQEAIKTCGERGSSPGATVSSGQIHDERQQAYCETVRRITRLANRQASVARGGSQSLLKGKVTSPVSRCLSLIPMSSVAVSRCQPTARPLSNKEFASPSRGTACRQNTEAHHVDRNTAKFLLGHFNPSQKYPKAGHKHPRGRPRNHVTDLSAQKSDNKSDVPPPGHDTRIRSPFVRHANKACVGSRKVAVLADESPDDD